MKIKIFILIIALVATVGSSWAQCPPLYTNVVEANRIDGYLTLDMTYEFDDATGTLIIASFGVDAMPDFQAGLNPWFQYARYPNGTPMSDDSGFGNKMEDESFRDRIKKIIIWCNVTRIGDNAFADCVNLEEVEIPNSVTSIGKNAFANCSKLKKVNLPDGLEIIDDYAFMSCPSLNSITIPASVQTLGQGVFFSCMGLQTIEVQHQSPLTITKENLIHDYPQYTGLKAIALIVPAGTESTYSSAEGWKEFGLIVENGAPYDKFLIDNTNTILVKYLGDESNVTIPIGIETIGGYAFSGNQNLEEIIFNNEVTEIEMGAFMFCSKLTSIDIPNTVGFIDGRAFMNCESLTSVKIPNSVVMLGPSMFIGSNNLQTVEVAWDPPKGVSPDMFGYTNTHLVDMTLVVPNGTTADYKAANVWGDFGIITDGTTALSDFTVDGNGVLTAYTGTGGDIKIPNTVKEMSLRVFDHLMYNLTFGTISIPKSVNLITEEPNTPMPFVIMAEKFDVDPANPNYCSEDGVLYNKNKTVMIRYPLLSANDTYVVPNSVQRFEQFAFFGGGENLEHMVIPCTLQDMGNISIAFDSSRGRIFETLEITGNAISPIAICLIEPGQPSTMHNRTLIVPAGMKAAYEASGNWNCAGDIVERAGVEPGFIKIRREMNADEYLGQSDIAATGPNILFLANMLLGDVVNTNFYIDEISSSQYVVALDAVKTGDYIRGKYIFNSGAAGMTDPMYMVSGYYNGLSQINAIRKDNILYILGNVVVTNTSDLENLASNNTIRKINLNTDKGFVFSFVPATQGATGVLIKSEASSSAEYVSFNNGLAVMSNDISLAESFTIEKANGSLEPIVEHLNLSATSLGFDANSGSETFDITSNAAWIVSSSDSWATVNTASGSGNGTIMVYVSENTISSARTATITVTGGGITKTLSVTQDGVTPAPFDFTVSTSLINVEGYGNQIFQITTSEDWTISSESSWILLHSESGTTNKEITTEIVFYVYENNTLEARTAEIEITSGGVTKVIMVTQAYEEKIITTPSTPTNNKGLIDLSLNVPSDQPLTGEFTVTMPNGFSLDKENTVLSQELRGNHSLEILEMTNGVWVLKITPGISVRSSSGTTYKKIVEIAYVIENSAVAGEYNIRISDLKITKEDNTVITVDNISVDVSHKSSVGNLFVDNLVKVTYYNNTISVNSSGKERVDVYSITGALLLSQEKPEGEVKYNIENLPAGIIIVKGSSGWVEKVMKR